VQGRAETTLDESPTDEELIRAVERGDRSAASELYDRLYPVVDRTLVRIMGRRECDHEDFIQATFEQIVLTIAKGKCSVVRDLDAWASTLSSRVAFNTLRSRTRERLVVDHGAETDESMLAIPCERDVEREVGVRQRIDRMRYHLSQMTEGRAMTLFLYDGLGYDLTEISELTRVSVAAAQSRLVRGRQQLRRRLEAEDESMEDAP
jgi:RNA polymerase sigma-70 factor, ECF subfamily